MKEIVSSGVEDLFESDKEILKEEIIKKKDIKNKNNNSNKKKVILEQLNKVFNNEKIENIHNLSIENKIKEKREEAKEEEYDLKTKDIENSNQEDNQSIDSTKIGRKKKDKMKNSLSKKKEENKKERKKRKITEDELRVKKKLEELYERRRKKMEYIEKKVDILSNYQNLKFGLKILFIKKFQEIKKNFFFYNDDEFCMLLSNSKNNLIEKYKKKNFFEKFEKCLIYTLSLKKEFPKIKLSKIFIFLLKVLNIKYNIIYFLNVEPLNLQKRFLLKLPRIYKLTKKKFCDFFEIKEKKNDLEKLENDLSEELNKLGIYLLINQFATKSIFPFFNGEQKKVRADLKSNIKSYVFDLNEKFDLIKLNNFSNEQYHFINTKQLRMNHLPFILQNFQNLPFFGAFLFNENNNKIEISEITKIILPQNYWAQIEMNNKSLKTNLVLDQITQNNRNLSGFQRSLMKKISKNRIPKSNYEFRVNPYYTLKSILNRNQILSKTAEKANFQTKKEEDVYYKKDIIQLNTKVKWKMGGREVKEHEKPLKTSSPPWDKSKIYEYFSYDQTKELKIEVINGELPKNEYGNIELFGGVELPEELVHLDVKGIWRVCKKFKLPYRKACTGFEIKKSRTVAVMSGIIVFKKNEKFIEDKWIVMEKEIKKKEKEKKRGKVLGRFKMLFKSILLGRYLNKHY